jgi:diguanylate cyclase (GGDEF)-like protein
MLSFLLVNGVALFLHGLLVVFCVISVGRMLMRRKYVRLPQFFIIAFCVLAWSIAAILRYVVPNEGVVYLTSFIPYVFSVFALIALFRFMMVFYNMNIFRKPHVLAAACVLPVSLLAAVVLSYIGYLDGSGWADLFRVHDAHSAAPFIVTPPYLEGGVQYNAVVGAKGVLLHIVSVFSILLASGLFAAALANHFKLPKICRPGSEKVLTGTVLVLTGYIISTFNSNAAASFFDVFSLTFFIIALRFFFNSTMESQGLVFLAQARSGILQNFEHCIFILNEDKNIVYCNDKAENTLNQHIGDSYQMLMERLEKNSKKCVKLSSEESGHDYYFDDKGEVTVYNLREKPIFDKKQNQIGTYAIYSDVTLNRKLIQRLEEGAGRDALTGLHNRSMMEKLKKELDKPSSLPLAILIFDLNDLKVTNDVHGHQAGDIMLRVCGGALTDNVPPTAQSGRIGGDEFMVLIPQTARLEAEALMDEVRNYLKEIKDYPFKIVMSMGCSIKEREDQEMRGLMEEADQAMYADKKRIKGGNVRNTETQLF